MASGKYLLLMLAMVAIIVSVSGGHRHRDKDSNKDSSDESDDDRSDDSDDDRSDDSDDDSDGDTDEDSCPGRKENHVCCNYVNHVVTVTRWREHPCNGSEDHRINNRYDNEPVCYKKVVYYVTIQVCYKVCCEGWVKDEFGRCTVPVPPDILCENGGTPDPSGSGYCICSNDFSGRQCETALCSPHCENGGECIADNGQTSCICTEGFTGLQCEQPICREICQNGGTCVSQGYYASCECSPGFTGSACEHTVRPGTCPSIRDMGNPSSTSSMCAFDDDCSAGDKCCSSYYGKFCVTPGTPTCLYDGKHYTQGQEVSKSDCEKCTCIRPSIFHQSDDELACYSIDCPPISCSDYTYPAGKCCPVCAGVPPREPQISDCPTKTVEVAVQSDKNMIRVTEKFKTIKAHDHNMNVLKVTFSHASLRSCACNYTELDFHHITAISEPDAYGRKAYCSFTVKVIDIHSPRFSHCPSMISAFTDQKIIWQAPAASDNVGVREVNLRTKYANNTMFPKGNHFVEYYAKDFHENVAVCRIPVSVYTRGTTDPSLPIGMRRTSTNESKHNLYIGVGAGAAVLLIILLVAVIYCRHHRTDSPPQNPPTTEKMPGAFNNGLYAEGMYPPPYDNIAFNGDKTGPPSYKPGSPPPTYRASIRTAEYETVGVSSVTSGIDNQMYMDESLYHSLQANSALSDKGREAEKSPPPSYRGALSSPRHYDELDVKAMANLDANADQEKAS